jgi:hypothetical protein
VKKAKIILLILAGLAVLAVAAVFIFVQNLDAMVKSAIEKYGSEAAGTTVRVQTVRIELESGRGSLLGLTVANPTGFSSERIFSLGEIVLALDPASLPSDLPVVKEIRIDAPTFRYEVNAQAQTNLGAIKQNLKRFSAGRSQPSRPAAEKSEERRLLVKRLTIAGGQGTLDLTAVGGKTLTAKMPPVTLTDIGGRQGLPPAALGEAILAALIKNLEQTAARQGVEQALRGKLGEEAGRLQQELDEKLAPGAGEALKKVLGR